MCKTPSSSSDVPCHKWLHHHFIGAPPSSSSSSLCWRIDFYLFTPKTVNYISTLLIYMVLLISIFYTLLQLNFVTDINLCGSELVASGTLKITSSLLHRMMHTATLPLPAVSWQHNDRYTKSDSIHKYPELVHRPRSWFLFRLTD